MHISIHAYIHASPLVNHQGRDLTLFIGYLHHDNDDDDILQQQGFVAYVDTAHFCKARGVESGNECAAVTHGRTAQ